MPALTQSPISSTSAATAASPAHVPSETDIWQATVDAVDAVVFLMDADGRVMRANQRALELAALQTSAPLVGTVVGMLASSQPWLQAREAVAAIFAGEPPHSVQVGDAFSPAMWDITAVRVAAASGDRCVIVAKDISSYIALESSARRNERVAEMGRLVGNVAHEARSPLFAISATVDALEARLHSAEPALGRYVENLRISLRRLTGLMSDLLDYGRPPLLEPTVELLARVVDDAVAAVRAAAAAKGIALRSEMTDADGFVLADRARLAQAVHNVLTNAVAHAPTGTSVTIRSAHVWRNGCDWVVCSIEDEGPGFAPHALERVFEPFYTTRPGGTGLGLSIVQRIAEMHGGSVIAANRVGGGARVTIHLPSRSERG